MMRAQLSTINADGTVTIEEPPAPAPAVMEWAEPGDDMTAAALKAAGISVALYVPMAPGVSD